DSGSGPPSGSTVSGWIRTGNQANPVSGALGQNNCNAWTSAAPSDAGTVAGLSIFWITGAGAVTVISPWSAGPGICVATNPVWCVQD
ncbi:MAG TPA: hypothetical protein VJS64_12275, partial [Pyrinomonadaceae bacterium]|nr:hypothetical protein [Pyrinomonadaceae bacterium]